MEVPPQLLAALQPRSPATQPPAMVTEFVPFQLQPRFFRVRPGMGPRGPTGPQLGLQDPLQAAREQRKQMQKRMQDMRQRAQGLWRGSP